MAGLVEVLKQNAVPSQLTEYLTATCGNTTIEMFFDMVVKADYEVELRDLVKAEFPVTKDFTEVDARRDGSGTREGSYLGGASSSAQK